MSQHFMRWLSVVSTYSVKYYPFSSLILFRCNQGSNDYQVGIIFSYLFFKKWLWLSLEQLKLLSSQNFLKKGSLINLYWSIKFHLSRINHYWRNQFMTRGKKGLLQLHGQVCFIHLMLFYYSRCIRRVISNALLPVRAYRGEECMRQWFHAFFPCV